MEVSLKMLLGGFGLILFIAYYSWVVYLKRRAEKLCGRYIHVAPPQFPQIPIIGNLIGNTIMFLSLKSSADVWELITRLSNRHRNGTIYWIFNVSWFLIQDLDVIETVLMSSEHTDKGYVYQLLNTITDGVFSCNGLRWRKLRKKLNLTFSPKQLEMFYQDINEQTVACINELKNNTNKYINIISFMAPYFFDTVNRTHFGVKTYEQKNRLMQITEKAAKVIELTIENRFFTAYNFFMAIFKLSRVSQFIDYMKTDTVPFVRNMIGQRLEEMKIEKSKGEERRGLIYTDLVKLTLEDLKMEPTVYNVERNSADVMIAASDTTSVAVSVLLYYICIYPEVQQKIYEEVLPIFGDNSTKELTKEDFNRMEYLEMVIKETLRLTAPPGIVRYIKRDVDVGKYVIPKGSNFFIAMKSIHHNPKYYERANEFYPEHFLPEKVKQRPKFAFLPYSHGPRNCPGMAYSYITMKSIISTIVRNFQLSTNIPLKEIKYKMALMQEHTNGYFVKLTPRNDILDYN